MDKISDYELMKRVVEENDEWSKIHLWHRYQPVVHKRSNYLIKVVGSRWEIEDLIQEFFIAFVNALDYIDLEKIPDETFHFGTIYFFFLRKTENRIKNKHFKISRIEEDSYERLFHPEKSILNNNDAVFEKKAKNAVMNNTSIFDFDESSVLFQSVELPSFRKTLTPDQNVILTDVLQRKKIVDISKSRKQKYSQVYKIITEIREKAKNHFVGVN